MYGACRTVKISEADYDRQLTEATVHAFAAALATAVVVPGEHGQDGAYCSSLVEVGVYTPNNFAQCWTTTDVFDDNDFTSAIVTAGASLRLWTLPCGKFPGLSTVPSPLLAVTGTVGHACSGAPPRAHTSG